MPASMEEDHCGLKSLKRDLVAAWLQMQAQLLLVHAQAIVNAAWFIHEWMALHSSWAA